MADVAHGIDGRLAFGSWRLDKIVCAIITIQFENYIVSDSYENISGEQKYIKKYYKKCGKDRLKCFRYDRKPRTDEKL